MSAAATTVITKEEREAYGNYAFNQGAIYALGTLTAVGLATLAANRFSPKFNRFMSISAKTSLPLMAGIGVGSYRFETVAHDVQLNPGKYGFGPAVVAAPKSTMPMHHQIMNSLYDHPFRIIAGLGVPFGAYILNEQLKLQHLRFSQRLMHSRVIIQFGVLSILITTMGFKTYMDTHGRFPEPKN